jgi:hypothetical protein
LLLTVTVTCLSAQSQTTMFHDHIEHPYAAYVGQLHV